MSDDLPCSVGESPWLVVENPRRESESCVWPRACSHEVFYSGRQNSQIASLESQIMVNEGKKRHKVGIEEVKDETRQIYYKGKGKAVLEWKRGQKNRES